MGDLSPGSVVLLPDGKRATVRYVGNTRFAAGDWIGLELEEPAGKNDGSVRGERYFDCEQDYGVFVRSSVTLTLVGRPAKPAPKGNTGNAPPTSRGRAQTGAGIKKPGVSALPSVNAKRHSVSTANPSSAVKAAPQRPGLRSPLKSPTKQPSSRNLSIDETSRPPTTRSRPSSTTKASMGPPPAPSAASRTPRPSISGPTHRARQSLGSTGAALSKRPSLRHLASNNSSAAETESGQSDVVTDSAGVEGDDPDDGSPAPRAPPGSSRMSIATARPRLSQSSTQKPPQNSTVSRELDELRTKLKVMEKKRGDDREKLKMLEQLQSERDKFEGIIQKLQAKYQPQQVELGELRKQLKESQARLEEIEQIQGEHDSVVEMATLDREMAEETADAYKHECDVLRGKLEELQLEVDVLRDENEEFDQGMSPEEKSTQGWLQMVKTNERLREALIRLRDVTQQQEMDLKDHIKEMEEDLEDYAAIKSQYETTKERLLASENNFEDLKQQLETALGAEEMIEELADKNMRYQEEINELHAAIEDLEALKEINDELEYNHVETEKQLQEEIEFKDGLFNEQYRKITQQDEVIEDLEYTLVRFRELVSTLQGDLEDMRASQQITEAEATDLTSRSRAMIDLNMKLQASASKAQTKTIDVETGRMEAEEAALHLSIVKLYLPEYYDGERNSVMALLRFKRVSFKASLVSSTIRDRNADQSSTSPSHEDFFTAHDVLEKLLWISSLCDRFTSYIESSSAESFSGIKGALFEMEPVERTLNFWLESLKKNEINMSKCAVELQRSIALLAHLAETMLPTSLEASAGELSMRAHLTQSYLDHSASCLLRLRSVLQSKISVPEGGNEEIPLLFNKMDGLSSQVRGSKVAMGKIYRAVSDLQARSLALPSDASEPFKKVEDSGKDLSSLSRQLGENILALIHDEARTEPLSLTETLDSLSQTSLSFDQVSEPKSENNDAMSLISTKLRSITESLEELDSISSNLSLTTEFEKRPAPWIARSEELKFNKAISPDADDKIRQLKSEIQEASTALGVKDKTIEEQAIKVELVESRMREASKKASMVKELEAKIEQLQAQHTDLTDTAEKQRKDLEATEAERDELKSRLERVKHASGTTGVTTTADGVVVDGSGASLATIHENEALRAEVQSLQAAVRFLREENRRANMLDPFSIQRAADMHSWLDVPLTQSANDNVSAQREKTQQTAAESRDAFAHLLKLAKDSHVSDLKSSMAHRAEGESRTAWRPSKTKLRYQVLQQRENYERWAEWRDDIVSHEKEQDRLVLAKKERLLREQARKHHMSRKDSMAAGEFGMMGQAWRILGMQHQHQQQGQRDEKKSPISRLVEPAIAPFS
ncbi:putative dynactin [Aspergillus glaucus CBS 516.65]|uniref:CAP-Gly domain-containing protein n=1 Tax=Aspergillus glaucus CBS 516.65 TaxID=1160497 RepID=A0A1L9VC67_ASPGL|nr:hypothetical protein ASPGLDRAFT_27900 [Aspergillus glaucus CBS 516.65]OJJ81514.1 hypothetical protein ASPGLDRAFT_27900 [Aspergillus glaucus CBS 516.65]